MSDEWADSDDPRLRALFGYSLRDHVRYQDGRDGLAPALVFADADYEVGDGTCGLHSDGKQANEPAIVYVRADALIDATARIAALEAERDAAECRPDIWASHMCRELRQAGYLVPYERMVMAMQAVARAALAETEVRGE